MSCFLIVMCGWILSVCLHEFGHAWVARRGGDHTVREKGYLTLNPFRYAHPVYSLLWPVVFLLLGGIGLPGGAVYINRHLLRSRGWEAATSLAGPAMNLALFLLLGLVFKLGLLAPDPGNVWAISLAFLLQLQVCALLLNLLPVPPLDGFQTLAPWLPEAWRRTLYSCSNAAMFLLFILLWNSPVINRALWTTVFTASDWMGAAPGLGARGWQAFRFWAH
jgi:Zn-dependent protease